MIMGLKSKNIQFLTFAMVFIGVFNFMNSSFLNEINDFSHLRHLQGSEKKIQVGTYSLKVLGHSGKIRLSSKDNSNTTNATESSIEITFDSLIERNSEGVEVGKSGKEKHSFNNFAQLDFQISDFIETKFQNLTVFKTSLVVEKFLGLTKFEAMVLIFNETGTINTGASNIVDVDKGTMKFSVVIQDWYFCSNETDTGSNCATGQNVEIGSYVDFTIGIKGRNSAKITDSVENKFSFGDSQIILPNYIQLDDTDSEMPEGYPLFSSNGSSNSFTFRFPKFLSHAFYDPVVQIINPESSSRFGLIIILVISALVLVALGAYCFCFRKKPDESRAAFI